MLDMFEAGVEFDYKYLFNFEMIEMYNNYLDTNNAQVHLAGEEYSPSKVLKAVDIEHYRDQYICWAHDAKTLLDDIEQRRMGCEAWQIRRRRQNQEMEEVE